MGAFWKRLKPFLIQEARHVKAWTLYGFVRLPVAWAFLKSNPKRHFKIAVAVLVLGITAHYAMRVYEYRTLYNQYYHYFYQAYEPRVGAADADRHAKFYAAFYATYYLSEDYRRSIASALPTAQKASRYGVRRSENRNLHLSAAGLAMLKTFEGFRKEAYRDVGGKMTIGYGHLIRRGELLETITEQKAEALLREDVSSAEAVVKRYVQVPLKQAQFDALVSLTYNIGEEHFRTSTLLRRLNNGDLNDAAEEFLRWKHVDGEVVEGLLKRRQQERTLFSSAR